MNTHTTREEDFDLYVLGVLEGDEKLAIESHAAECADCARRLAEARGRIALLALAAPRVEPSPAVKQRLKAQVRADAEAETRSSAALAPSRSPKSRQRAPGFFDRWRAGVLIPAFAVLAIATVVLWQQNRDLDRQLAALRASSYEQQQHLDEARNLDEMMESRDTVTIALAPQAGMPQGSAHVMYNARMGMLMYDGEIAPAPAAKSYQLWLVPAVGQPISAGVFNPVSGRGDHWMMKLPQGIEPKMFAVSLEPAGGMPQPTGPMVLIGHA
jgi:anti-sigma-K factor RskA